MPLPRPSALAGSARHVVTLLLLVFGVATARGQFVPTPAGPPAAPPAQAGSTPANPIPPPAGAPGSPVQAAPSPGSNATLPRPPGPGAPVERKLVATFDKDGNGRLNLEERQAALQSLGGGASNRVGRGRMATPSQPGDRILPADVAPYPTTPIYDLGTLRTFFIEFEEPNWEAEMVAFNNTDVEVEARVTVDGRAYPGVGVHFRGNSSFGAAANSYKRSLNLTFDFADPAQNLGGYRTFNLLNSNGDPTLMRSVLFATVAREYIPTFQANFVQVVINGENWGVYQNVQQFNKEMVQEWFHTTKGARWKVPGNPGGQGSFGYLGDAIEPYRRIYTIKSKDDPRDWEAFIAMLKVLNQAPPEELEARLGPLLDIDGVLKFLALDNALLNEDGYWTRASDFNIYRDEQGRFHVLPHDANETFFNMPGPAGRGPAGADGVSLSPLVNEGSANRPLAAKLLAVPALKTRYLDYVRDIARTWLDWKRLGPLVEKNWALIAVEAARDTKKLDTTENFVLGTANSPSPGGRGGVISLRDFADKRRAYLLQFLADQQTK